MGTERSWPGEEDMIVRIMEWFPPINNPRDVEHVTNVARMKYRSGWTFEDTVCYCLFTEECSPEIAEDVALKAMELLEQANPETIKQRWKNCQLKSLGREHESVDP